MGDNDDVWNILFTGSYKGMRFQKKDAQKEIELYNILQ